MDALESEFGNGRAPSTASFRAGETVITAGSTTGRLLILRKGGVAVLKEGVEIATVTEPGAVFGDLSVLLDQPHTADVRAGGQPPKPPSRQAWYPQERGRRGVPVPPLIGSVVSKRRRLSGRVARSARACAPRPAAGTTVMPA